MKGTLPNFPAFEFTGQELIWRRRKSTPGCGWVWSNVATPEDAAKNWDGAAWANRAILVRQGQPDQQFAYIELRETGRGKVQIPGLHGWYGLKCRMTFSKGTDDESTVDAWLHDVQ